MRTQDYAALVLGYFRWLPPGAKKSLQRIEWRISFVESDLR